MCTHKHGGYSAVLCSLMLQAKKVIVFTSLAPDGTEEDGRYITKSCAQPQWDPIRFRAAGTCSGPG